MHGFWAPLHPSDTVVKRNGPLRRNGSACSVATIDHAARRDLGRGPVRQDRLLAAHLLQGELAAFVKELNEPIKAVAAITVHLAGLANVAELP